MIRSQDWEQKDVRKSAAVNGIDITETRANASKSLPFGSSESATFTSSTNLSNPSFSSKFRLTSILGILTTESRPYRLLVKGFQHTNVKEASFGCVQPIHLHLRDFGEILHRVSDRELVSTKFFAFTSVKNCHTSCDWPNRERAGSENGTTTVIGLVHVKECGSIFSTR